MTDYKGDFDKALAELVDTRERLLEAESLSIISSLERKAQQEMFAIQHFSMRLAYWVKEAADKRRQELRSAPVFVSNDVHEDRIGLLKETKEGAPKRKTAKRSSKAKSSAKKSASEN